MTSKMRIPLRTTIRTRVGIASLGIILFVVAVIGYRQVKQKEMVRAQIELCQFSGECVTEIPNFNGFETPKPGKLVNIPSSIVTIKNSTEKKLCNASRMVLVVVHPDLEQGIRTKLTRFENDLCAENYGVIEKVASFGTPHELRQYLIDTHKKFPQTEGVIFIGDIPLPYQYVTLANANKKLTAYSQEVVSLQYYSDLDGIFSKSKGYSASNPKAYSWDEHTGETDWELWVGVLPIASDLKSSVSAINRYFDKNHIYRTTSIDADSDFVQISELYKATTATSYDYFIKELKEGLYAWTPFSNGVSSRLYIQGNGFGPSIEEAYEYISSHVVRMVVQDTHGNPWKAGELDFAWIEDNGLDAYFFWSNGCAIGNLTYETNILEKILYADKSRVVIAKGTTNDSGGLGTNEDGFFGHNVAQLLSDGENFGATLVKHVNKPLLNPWAQSREFHFATTIILGDPTLTLSKK